MKNRYSITNMTEEETHVIHESLVYYTTRHLGEGSKFVGKCLRGMLLDGLQKDFAVGQSVTAVDSKATLTKTSVGDVIADDGWIEWEGGECPVPPGTPVNYRMRNGVVSSYKDGARLSWRLSNKATSAYPYDIVSYRISEPGIEIGDSKETIGQIKRVREKAQASEPQAPPLSANTTALDLAFVRLRKLVGL